MENETLNEEVAVSTEDLHGENLTDRVRVLSPGMMVAKRFFRSKLSMIGLITLILLFLFSFVGPLISPWGEMEQDTNPNAIKEVVVYTPITYEDENGELVVAYNVSVSKGDINKKGDPSWTHWLGTDENGWDIFTRLMYGGRISLTIGFVVVLLETIIGVVLGGFAGYFGGWVDQLIMRIVDILSCIPTLPIMLILSATFTSMGITDIRRL